MKSLVYAVSKRKKKDNPFLQLLNLMDDEEV